MCNSFGRPIVLWCVLCADLHLTWLNHPTQTEQNLQTAMDAMNDDDRDESISSLRYESDQLQAIMPDQANYKRQVESRKKKNAWAV